MVCLVISTILQSSPAVTITYNPIISTKVVGSAPGVSFDVSSIPGMVGNGVVSKTNLGGGEGSVLQGGTATLNASGAVYGTKCLVRFTEEVKLANTANGTAYPPYYTFQAKATGTSKLGNVTEIAMTAPNMGIAVSSSNTKTYTRKRLTFIPMTVIQVNGGVLPDAKSGSIKVKLPQTNVTAVATASGYANFYVAASASSNLTITSKEMID